MSVLTKEENEKKQLAFELVDEARQKLYAGKLKESRDVAVRACEIFMELEEKRNLAITLNILGVVYDDMGYDSIGLPCFLDALEIALDEKQYDLASKIYNNLGSKFMFIDAYDKALSYFIQSLELLEKAKELDILTEKDRHSFVMVLYLNLSLTFCRNGNFDKTRFYYEEGLKLSEHPMNKSLWLTFRSFAALILWKMGEKDKSLENIDYILNSADQIKNATNLMETMSYIFEVLKALKDYSRWEKALNIMDDKLDSSVGLTVKVQALDYWMYYYEDIGDKAKYEDACVHYHKMSRLKQAEDLEKHAYAVEMEAEMRRTTREKRKTDKYIFLDTLTGIGNRNKMLKDSKRYIADSIVGHHSIAVGLIDIDYFKECNDTYGHVRGDECLKTVATILQESVGDRGSVYRYGGDEFLVLIPVIDDKALEALGKEVKDKLEKARIPNRKSPVSKYVTISQGYTRAMAEEGDTIETLINLADRVLYAVKRFGRNSYRYSPINEIE